VKTKNIDNLLWFKKDLRVTDHEPLFKAVSSGSTLALYIIENEWLQSQECSDFHKQFLKDSLTDLSRELEKRNIPFLVVKGGCLAIFNELKEKYDFKKIFSHEETGLMWTYERDLKVKSWCKENSIHWEESKQFAILRGLKDRDQWNRSRSKIIERDLIPDIQQSVNLDVDNHIDLSSLETTNRSQIQKGGVDEGVKTLKSFYDLRGENYYKELSSPVTAFESCSRISPYISWGNLSLSQIQKSLQIQRQKLSYKSNWDRSLKAFESRLWWHCHFIQKLESEPEIEFENVNRAFDGMRENSLNKSLLSAWEKGETGFPLIDACMRALKTEGWINFRMRAMLVSFASYQLWVHWREQSHHLARLFVDFEPGIHFNQLQMQSGVTGINSIRIYSPVKQTLDQDPQGTFIKKYCPELSELDPKFLAKPWEAPPMILKMADVNLGENYPIPIVDEKLSYKKAKDTIFEWRKKPEVIEESKYVYKRHGSRKHKRFPSQHRRIFQ